MIPDDAVAEFAATVGNDDVGGATVADAVATSVLVVEP